MVFVAHWKKQKLLNHAAKIKQNTNVPLTMTTEKTDICDAIASGNLLKLLAFLLFLLRVFTTLGDFFRYRYVLVPFRAYCHSTLLLATRKIGWYIKVTQMR